MIESIFNHTPKAEACPALPALFRNIRSSGLYVVLFSEPSTGTVVMSTYDAPHVIGLHSSSWVDYRNRDHWEPLYLGESITLTVK